MAQAKFPFRVEISIAIGTIVSATPIVTIFAIFEQSLALFLFTTNLDRAQVSTTHNWRVNGQLTDVTMGFQSALQLNEFVAHQVD